MGLFKSSTFPVWNPRRGLLLGFTWNVSVHLKIKYMFSYWWEFIRVSGEQFQQQNSKAGSVWAASGSVEVEYNKYVLLSAYFA